MSEQGKPDISTVAFSFSRAHERASELGMGPDEALGYALAAEYSAREPVIDHDNIIVGMPGSLSLVQLERDGLCCVSEVPQTLIGTYFRLGGQQLQVNVVERETLIAAQQEPEKHEGLVVRVAGFSAKFVTLERALQDDIIARIAHEI